MDMRKYSAGIITSDDLHDGPQTEKIINIYENEKHKCAVLEFESGNQLYLWGNLARVLYKAWGYDSGDWLNQEVELKLGHYLDKKAVPPTEKDCIVIRAVSPAKPKPNGGTPVPALSAADKRGDMDDDIPW
jgi:hypothetical protein